MKLILLTVFLLFCPALSNAEPITLQKAYDKTIEQSEKLKRTESDIKIAQAKYDEAISAIYPKLSLNVSQQSSDFDDNNSSDRNKFRTFASVQQPIFRGFREFLLSDAARGEREAARLESIRVKELLYLDVSDVFHQIYLYENDIKLLKEESRLLHDRIDEINKLLSLGRTRESEIAAVESDLASLKAAISNQNGALAASKELFTFLTGIPTSDIKIKLELISPILPIESYLQRIKERADLKAYKSRIESKQNILKVSEREWWPTLTFEGNIYPYEDPNYGREWDVIFQLSVPIFEGGAIDARITQREQELLKEELSQKESTEIADKDLRVVYEEAKATREVLSALRAQVKAAEKNTQFQRKDYELGVVTNLEVLTAIRSEQRVKRELLSAEAKLRNALVQLTVTAGGV